VEREEKVNQWTFRRKKKARSMFAPGLLLIANQAYRLVVGIEELERGTVQVDSCILECARKVLR
jgi:hypothetical protein